MEPRTLKSICSKIHNVVECYNVMRQPLWIIQSYSERICYGLSLRYKESAEEFSGGRRLKCDSFFNLVKAVTYDLRYFLTQ